MPSGRVRVFVTDDHEVVRDALVRMLTVDPGIEVVGASGTVAGSLTGVLVARPDVTLLDAKLPDGSGIELCRKLREALPETRCVILTGLDDPVSLAAAFDAGASAFLSKQARPAALIEAVRQAAITAPTPVAEPNPQTLGVGTFPASATHTRLDPQLAGLTTRELQVLQLITEGLTNRQIGYRLAISERTVKNIVSHVLDKLHLRRRTQAALLGAQLLKETNRLSTIDGPSAVPRTEERPTRPPAKSRVSRGSAARPHRAHNPSTC